ncbi:MAG: hypothetical protein H0U53_04585, partial [Actinobacteria bacterium]|nr:hypothetical protein [Actinomycetota bacterium]
MAETVSAPPKGLELYAPPRLQKPLSLPGKRGEGLKKLGIESVQDLLQHYPRYHVDRTQLRTIRDLGRLLAEGHEGEVSLLAKVVKMNRPFRTRSGKVMVKGLIKDDTGSIAVTWFNQEWLIRALPPGTEAFFYGKLTIYGGKLQMTSPRHEPVKTGKEPFNVGRIIPIYPATADLGSDALRKLMWETLG